MKIRIPTTLTISLAALAAGLIPGAGEWLQYDRLAIGQGEVWRLVTGHLAHWSGEQLFWDLIVFAVLGALCERRDRRGFRICLALGTIVIAAGVWVLIPGMRFYRGLSGIDSALFTMVGAQMLHEKIEAREWGAAGMILALGAGFIAKVAYEQWSGATLFVRESAEMMPVPLAHLGGAAAGIVAERWSKWTTWTRWTGWTSVTRRGLGT